VVVDGQSWWSRLHHRLGTREWTLRDADGEEVSPGARGANLDLGAVVLDRLKLLGEAEWADDTGKLEDWPEDAA